MNANMYSAARTRVEIIPKAPRQTPNHAFSTGSPLELTMFWIVYNTIDVENVIIAHTRKTGGRLSIIACPCNPRGLFLAFRIYVNYIVSVAPWNEL
jgi:hypothetical protein